MISWVDRAVRRSMVRESAREGALYLASRAERTIHLRADEVSTTNLRACCNPRASQSRPTRCRRRGAVQQRGNDRGFLPAAVALVLGSGQRPRIAVWFAIVSTEELLKRITIDPEICHGKPSIRGLRYPVTMLLELMSSGMTNEEILASYEDLERDDLLAALAYAARLSDAKRVVLAG